MRHWQIETRHLPKWRQLVHTWVTVVLARLLGARVTAWEVDEP